MSQYSVHIEARFEAAHNLRSYRGTAEPLHGHSYRVVVELTSKSGGLDSDSIAVDFVSAKSHLESLAKKLDYGYINDVEPFTGINPSAENIAAWFHRELSQSLEHEDAIVRSVTLWEGPTNHVTYTPDDVPR
ncbi:MAG: 6-carboxytetrahydropterin synthase [Acidobacteriota bacterium]